MCSDSAPTRAMTRAARRWHCSPPTNARKNTHWQFASATEVVTLDPSDKREASFLTDLKVAPDTTEAVTVFVVPPGQAVARVEGATNKESLVEVLSKAGTSCGPEGCGPDGCGPKK